MRRARGNITGIPYYKGGFESKMNRREAALILQLKYALLTEVLKLWVR